MWYTEVEITNLVPSSHILIPLPVVQFIIRENLSTKVDGSDEQPFFVVANQELELEVDQVP